MAKSKQHHFTSDPMPVPNLCLVANLFPLLAFLPQVCRPKTEAPPPLGSWRGFENKKSAADGCSFGILRFHQNMSSEDEKCQRPMVKNKQYHIAPDPMPLPNLWLVVNLFPLLASRPCFFHIRLHWFAGAD